MILQERAKPSSAAAEDLDPPFLTESTSRARAVGPWATQDHILRVVDRWRTPLFLLLACLSLAAVALSYLNRSAIGVGSTSQTTIDSSGPSDQAIPFRPDGLASTTATTTPDGRPADGATVTSAAGPGSPTRDGSTTAPSTTNENGEKSPAGAGQDPDPSTVTTRSTDQSRSTTTTFGRDGTTSTRRADTTAPRRATSTTSPQAPAPGDPTPTTRPDPITTRAGAPTTRPDAPTTRPDPTTTTTRPATTTTRPATTTTTSPPPPAEIDWAMGTGGATTARALLPLDSSLRSGSLGNYDTDRDGDPGLLLQKGEGLGEQDTGKMQRWWHEPGQSLHIQGTPQLDIWVATKDFDTGKSGRIVAGLYECTTPSTGCSLLGSASGSFNQSGFGNDFGRLVLTMPSIDRRVAPGNSLLLKIAVPGNSDDDLWIAYGTTSYPTSLSID